ncbi:MAG: hypothetical protein ABR905_06920 [Terracidiphilus sp.]|jgi:hypothetical protein
MNWKKLLSDFVMYMAMLFACFLMIEWNRRTSHFISSEFVENALASIAVALGIAGYQALDRSGHIRSRRFLRNGFIAWFAVYLLLFAIESLAKTTIFDFPIAFSLYPLLLLIVAPFPLALYLTRNQPKSTAQPASTKAS